MPLLSSAAKSIAAEFTGAEQSIHIPPPPPPQGSMQTPREGTSSSVPVIGTKVAYPQGKKGKCW